MRMKKKKRREFKIKYWNNISSKIKIWKNKKISKIIKVLKITILLTLTNIRNKLLKYKVIKLMEIKDNQMYLVIR
jgi:hypothetical protein